MTTARGTLPLVDATVTVTGSDEDNRHIAYSLKTNRSGQTEKIYLPAPSATLSFSPENENVFSAYDIEVNADGYYTHLSLNVPIFAGITSVQPADMIPKSAFRPEENCPYPGLTTDETEPER